MLNSNGVVVVMHLQQQKVIRCVTIKEELQAAVEGESYNSLCWLGDSSYLILFHGALYTWDSLMSHMLFCQYIPCHVTNPALRAVTHVCVGPSLVVLTYAYGRLVSFPVERARKRCIRQRAMQRSRLPTRRCWASPRSSSPRMRSLLFRSTTSGSARKP